MTKVTAAEMTTYWSRAGVKAFFIAWNTLHCSCVFEEATVNVAISNTLITQRVIST